MVDRLERNKDLIQELVESTAVHVGSITTIITKAVADVAREIGEIITDGFEMREAAKLAEQDEARHVIDIDTEDPELDDQADLPVRDTADYALTEDDVEVPTLDAEIVEHRHQPHLIARWAAHHIEVEPVARFLRVEDQQFGRRHIGMHLDHRRARIMLHQAGAHFLRAIASGHDRDEPVAEGGGGRGNGFRTTL